MSSDIRKWFMKPHDKNAGAAKPSGTGTGAAAAKKPVLSIPEKPAPSSVSGSQDASARRKTSKYFAPKTEKDSDVTDKSLPKRKLHKSSDQLEDDSKPLAANRIPKDEEEDDDDDFVAPSKRKTPVKPPPSKKLKAASNDDDEDERMDEDAKTPSKAAGRGRGRGRGGRGAVHAKTATPDDDVGGGEDRMDEDAKTPSKSTGRGRGRGRGGSGGGIAHGKTTGLDDDAEEDRMDEDDKTPSKAAGRGRGGRGAGSTPGGRGRGGGGRGFMNFGERKDPPHKGEKEVPEGAPDCLAGLTFVISGTLDSLEREEAGDVIKRYGGRVTGSISKKTNYLLADEDVGGVKSNKAKDLGVPFLTEDGLFDMIRKSKPAKAPANKHENNSNSEKLQKSQTKSSPVKVEKRAVEQVSTMDKSIASKSEIASTNNQKAKVVDRGSLQWTEKYRPKVPNDIVGNQSMVKQLHDWLKSWEEQFLHPGQKGKGKKQTDGGAKKAVLLSGPPGIGKTTTAKVVSQMLGLQAIEVNASDSRGKADSKIEKGVGGSTSNSIKELISNATLNYSDNRTKKPKAVLIMDEVDGMSAGDRGGVADLIASIKISKIPIVCICNDRFSQKLKSLVNYCLLLNFRKPTKQQMGKRLMEIARKEGIQAQENAMEELAERVHGDIRMALNHLQYMSLSQSVVKYDDIRLRLNSSAKDEDISPFTAVDKLFGFNGGRLRMDERMDLSMSDPDLVPLIIQENYINYRPSAVGKDDSGVKRMNYLARAAESLADGDIVNVQIRRYRQWQLSQAACFASSIVPAALMHGNREVLEAGERNFNRFGGWLGKYSTTNKNKRLMEDVHSHILASQQANVDREALRLDYLTLLLRQLTGPLKTMPKDEAVQKVVEFMDTYCLTQEDFDTLVELSKFKGHPNPMDGIQPAVKSALTKAYKQGSSCRVIRSARTAPSEGRDTQRSQRSIHPIDQPTMASSELTYRGHDAQPQADGAGAGAYGAGESKPRNKPLLSSQPLRYVLGEQRLAFALVGMAIATLLFLLLAPASTTTTSSSNVASLAAVGLVSRQYKSGGAGRMAYEAQQQSRLPAGGRVPLGLKRKGLRIVVTGGAGFVGSHLVDRLLARGDSVIVVDNFFTGNKENVAHHAGNPNFEMIRHDVVEPILLEVDQIYHLACPASPVHYKFNPVKTIKTNVVGTLNMLGLAKRVGARFLLTSTSEVYGDPLQHPQVETYWGNVNPIGVRSCYDEGKRTAETLTMDYHRGANLEVRIARIFNTYGPRMCIDDGRVVSNFVAQALRKEPLTVYGDGKQTRSFQYVSDLVEGLMKLMEGEHIGPFNLGNPGEFTMLELAKVVQDVIDPNAKIEFRANTADDPHKRKPDITKAKDLLGWEPKIPLNKGLPLMVQDFRNRIFGDQKNPDTAQ